MKDLLAKYNNLKVEKKRGGINSRFNDEVYKVMVFMGEDPTNTKRFKYWCGRLARIDVSTIRTWRKNDGRKPRALFNWKLKEYRQKEKKLSTQKPNNSA